ncbi:MAG: NfeD family protein [Planctomycetota bacterium]
MIYYAFGLLALGLVFITLEVFFPSFGMLGTLAAASIIGGGVIAYMDESTGIFLGYLLFSFILIPCILLFALKIFPKTPVGRHFTLAGPSFDRKEAQATEKGIEDLLGKEGETMTPLHPTGIATIDNKRVDVVTRGEMLEKETIIRVVKVEGNRIVVERSDSKKTHNA